MKLPATEKLSLDSNDTQWRLLYNGLINELPTCAIINITPERPIRIKIILQKAIPPENLHSEGRLMYQSNLGQSVNNGLSRAQEFLYQLLDKEMWLLFGYIDGQNKVPILIIHHSLLKITIYTQKLNNENINSFSSLNSLN